MLKISSSSPVYIIPTAEAQPYLYAEGDKALVHCGVADLTPLFRLVVNNIGHSYILM